MDELDTKEKIYDRITPALKAKESIIKRDGIDYIKKEDIWNYLTLNVWCNKQNLTLGEMVDDIFKLDNKDLIKYMEDMLKNTKRNIIL